MIFGKPKKYLYLIENLTEGNAPILRHSLLSVREIADVKISVTKGLIEVHAKRNPEASVELACGVAHCRLRTAVHKSEI